MNSVEQRIEETAEYISENPDPEDLAETYSEKDLDKVDPRNLDPEYRREWLNITKTLQLLEAESEIENIGENFSEYAEEVYYQLEDIDGRQENLLKISKGQQESIDELYERVKELENQPRGLPDDVVESLEDSRERTRENQVNARDNLETVTEILD